MKKLKWVSDAGQWDVDISTPATLDGIAKPVPGNPLPLGLSRGATLSRHKQLDFFHRFMSSPLVPSYSGDPQSGGHGLTLQRVVMLPFRENWFAAILGQFNLQKLISAVKMEAKENSTEPFGPKRIWRHLHEKSLYALNFCTEFLMTPSSSLLLSSEMHGDKKGWRNKALFHHKFPLHNLLLEVTWPRLSVDKMGTYWDVPMTMAVDIGSVASDSGLSYHLCVDNKNGIPKQVSGDKTSSIPAALLPLLCVKAACSYERYFGIWRKKDGKLKMVQPYDMFLAEPHVTACGVIGNVISASFGSSSTIRQLGNEMRAAGDLGLLSEWRNSLLSADTFASLSCTAQHGNFQRLFMDLTQLYCRLEISSGASFLRGVTRLAYDAYNKNHLDLEAVCAVCPRMAFSFQQQIAGPFSFRVDSTIKLDTKDGVCVPRMAESIYALEYALQVLGAAKAVAWYSPSQKEAMIELRFYEH